MSAPQSWFRSRLYKDEDYIACIVYLAVALECDTPILEAFYYAHHDHRLIFTGTQSTEARAYFAQEVKRCLLASPRLKLAPEPSEIRRIRDGLWGVRWSVYRKDSCFLMWPGEKRLITASQSDLAIYCDLVLETGDWIRLCVLSDKREGRWNCQYYFRRGELRDSIEDVIDHFIVEAMLEVFHE
jgi:hypothetical protein